jgi:uncharacterized membrane protein
MESEDRRALSLVTSALIGAASLIGGCSVLAYMFVATFFIDLTGNQVARLVSLTLLLFILGDVMDGVFKSVKSRKR